MIHGQAYFNNVYKGTKKQQSEQGLKCFYTNGDQFVNKRDDLIMFIGDDTPDVILITEVITKKTG